MTNREDTHSRRSYFVVANFTVTAESPADAASVVRQALMALGPAPPQVLDWKVPVKLVEDA